MSLNDKIIKAHQNKNFSLLVELYQEAAENVPTFQEQNFFSSTGLCLCSGSRTLFNPNFT